MCEGGARPDLGLYSSCQLSRGQSTGLPDDTFSDLSVSGRHPQTTVRGTKTFGAGPTSQESVLTV